MTSIYHSNTPSTISPEPEMPVRYITPIESMAGIDDEDTQLLRSLASRAKQYLDAFDWCKTIEQEYFGAGIGGIVGIFFFYIRPNNANIDNYLWVVVGDLPSAYLVTDQSKTPAEALVTYIREMRRWVKLARTGQTSREVIPVNVSPTPEWAKELDERLDVLENSYLPFFREAETKRA